MAGQDNTNRQVKKRRQRVDGWTIARRKIFLDTLAATCNVTEAARTVGMSVSGARALRARDGEFSLLWSQAFDQGEERLREECIAVALGQVSSGNNPSGEREPVETGPFDAALAIKLLGLRSAAGSARRTRRRTLPSQHEVDAALIARFDALDRCKARLAAKAAAAPADPSEPGEPA